MTSPYLEIRFVLEKAIYYKQSIEPQLGIDLAIPFHVIKVFLLS